MATNITWHAGAVTHEERAAFTGQKVRLAVKPAYTLDSDSNPATIPTQFLCSLKGFDHLVHRPLRVWQEHYRDGTGAPTAAEA